MTPAATEDGDTYWYVNGEKYFWHYQPDVFAFRKINGEPWSGALDTNSVEFIFHRGMHSDKMNILYFKNECSPTNREMVKEDIRNSTGFESEFPIITLYPDKPFSDGAWLAVDDLLLVNFDAEKLNQTTFNTFKQKYGLEQINFPDSIFPENIITHIFRTDATQQNTIDLAQLIFTQDSGLVKNVQPNLIYAYEETSNESINLLNSNRNEMNADDVEYYLVNNQNGTVKMLISFKVPQARAQLKIYDLFGREMAHYELPEQKTQVQVQLSEYSSGIYFACIENKEGAPLGVEKFFKL